MNILVTDQMIFTIIRNLQNLQVLDIITESGISEQVFTGINKHILQRAVDVEQLEEFPDAVDNLKRTSCLRDLTCTDFFVMFS